MARERDDDYEDDADERPARKNKGGSGEPIQNYLVQSILVTLCCCLPLGIVAILSAVKVNPLVADGKMTEAREAAAAAKKFSTFGAIGGVVLYIIVVIINVIIMAAGAK